MTGIDLESRLTDYVATIDRYDLLLGLIPSGFAAAVLAGRLLGLPVETTLLWGVAIAAIALLDGLFVRPPTKPRDV
ncbi:hypothetical protein FEJ81_03455 [Natrinema versiforme]|uniref:Uncharacterized protein n=1 Tax=Natrinema versiforme TaxID=88724 RepID=A0A4P8WQ23_9EURY|nr:hypothetical protein [Natrinema versiforme]QCS44261.1 hypothetical protein FEJ81_03455 [Natrinema versiforme]